MKKTFLLTAALLGFSSLLFADARGDALTSQYETAVARAVEPIRKKYLEELKKLLDEHVKRGNLDEANAIKKKITDIEAVKSTKAESDVFREFAGKSLANPAGTVVFEFKPDGTGVKHAYGQDIPFTWKVDGDYAAYNGARTAGGPLENLFFKFKNIREVECGSVKEVLQFPFEVVR